MVQIISTYGDTDDTFVTKDELSLRITLTLNYRMFLAFMAPHSKSIFKFPVIYPISPLTDCIFSLCTFSDLRRFHMQNELIYFKKFQGKKWKNPGKYHSVLDLTLKSQ